MSRGEKKKTALVLVLIIILACNLRAPITGCGALTNIMRESLGLSAGTAGVITTVPVLAFAVISPFVFWINKAAGAGRTVFISMLLLVCGIIMRSFAGETGVFAGMALIGLGIGICNVLIPAIIKDRFPDRIGAMTGMYTAVMQVTSTVSTAVSVPIASSFGWNTALFVWIVTAAAALICSIPNIGMTIEGEKDISKGDHGKLYGSSMTWWVTAYMGVQSLLFYSFVAWLSPIMQSRGYTITQSGFILSVYIIMGIVGSCALPFIMKINKSQSHTGLQIGVAYFIGVSGMMFGHGSTVTIASIILCGFLSGICVSFAMALFGLHTSCGEAASRLSGFAQSIGYLIAAAGPVMTGKLHEVTASWSAPFVVFMACAAFLIVSGYVVGKDKIIM